MAFRNSLRMLLTFSNCCGLAPFGKWTDGRLSADPLFKKLPFLVLFLLLGLQTFIILDLSGTSSLSPTNTYIADLIDTYGFACTCIGAFIAHTLLSTDLLTICKQILHLHRSVPHSSKTVFIDIIGGLTYEIIFATLSIVLAPFDYLNVYFYVLETFTYVALELTSFVIFLQFIHLILACRRCFRSLNAKIERLMLLFNSKLSGSDKKRFQKWLRHLGNEHSEIVLACRKVNKLFGFQNLLSLVLISLELTYSMYSAIRHTQEDTSIAVFLDTILWAGYFAYKLFATLRVCVLTSSAEHHTELLLHQLSLNIDDDETAEQVQIFAIQLLHEKTTFDALGFFSLDWSLIYSMIGGVAGYILILMQSYDEQDDVFTNHTSKYRIAHQN